MDRLKLLLFNVQVQIYLVEDCQRAAGLLVQRILCETCSLLICSAGDCDYNGEMCGTYIAAVTGCSTMISTCLLQHMVAGAHSTH